MLKLATLALALSACATHPGAFEHQSATRTGFHLNLSQPVDSVTPAFPEIIEREVPNIDRMAHTIRARLGQIAVARLELCVAPDGHVTKAEVIQSSGYAVFDAALERDAADWQFAALPGPASVKSCRKTTVAYHAR